jgi:hypothetical protein
MPYANHVNGKYFDAYKLSFPSSIISQSWNVEEMVDG